ncbi:MAG: hypothetical protein WAT78_05855 [Rhizobiaceae bacterium]
MSKRQSPPPSRRLAGPASLFVAALLLSGCASAGLGGGKLDAGVKDQPEALIAALGNGLIPPDLAKSLSAAERNQALQAEYKALEYSPGGEAVGWKSPRAEGVVTAGQPYQVGSQNCRQYSHAITAKGRQVSQRGSACRNPDGSWTPLA